MDRTEALARIEALSEWQNGEFVDGELVIYRRPPIPQNVLVGQGAVRAPPFTGMPLELRQLWPD